MRQQRQRLRSRHEANPEDVLLTARDGYRHSLIDESDHDDEEGGGGSDGGDDAFSVLTTNRKERKSMGM